MSNQMYYACTSDSILRITSGGAVRTVAKSGNGWYLAVLVLPSGRILAAADSGVYMQEHDTLWTRLGNGLKNVTCLANDGNGGVLAGTHRDGVYYAQIPTAVNNTASPPNSMMLSIAPNPATNALKITYTLARAFAISLDITDIAGRIVRRVLSPRVQESGVHIAHANLAGLPAGNYWCRLREGGSVVAEKVVLEK